MRFDPVTDAELPALIEDIVREYAAQKVEHGGWGVADAEKSAASETAESFPEGRPMPGHEIYLIRDAADTEDSDADAGATQGHVGYLWVGALRSRPQTFFVYDIHLRPEARGRGWGRATMAFAEERARARGCTELALHTFAGSTGAIALYESLGFHATDISMKKVLDS